MEDLHQLISILSKQQIKVLRSYLTSFSTRDTNTKYWELVSLFLKDINQIPDTDECSMAIYGEPADDRIRKLKDRVYDKVIDSLLIDINLNAFEYVDEIHPVQVRLRKKMMVFDLLQHTSLRQTVGMKLVDEVIETAKKYELYSILLDAIYIKKWSYGLRNGVDFFRAISETTRIEGEAQAALRRANDMSTELGNFSVFNPNASPAKLKKYLFEGVNELTTLYENTGVRSVFTTLQAFKVAYNQVINNTDEAIDIAMETLAFLEERKSFFRKTDFGIWNSHLSQLYVEKGDYQLGLDHLLIGRTYFAQNQFNIINSKRLEAHYRFLLCEYENSIAIIDQILGTNKKVTGEFRHDLNLYYKACYHFALGDFKECSKILRMRFEISKDKLGWEVNLRVLRIMTMLELDRPDEAFDMVRNLSKHAERHQINKDLSPRDKLTIELFRDIQKEGFALRRPSLEAYRCILLLGEKNKSHSWDPMGTELIKVHDWVKSKYQLFLAPAPEKTYRGRAGKKAKGNT